MSFLFEVGFLRTDSDLSLQREINMSCICPQPTVRDASLCRNTYDTILTSMYLLLLLLLVLASSPCASGLTFAGCNNTRAAVLECIEQLLDLDHNGQITPVEAAVALRTTFSFVPEWLTWQLIMRCDLNEDGVLSMDDWNANPVNITCLPTPNCLAIACSVCVQNGFAQTKRSMTEEEFPPFPLDDGEKKHRVRRPLDMSSLNEIREAARQIIQEMNTRPGQEPKTGAGK